MPIHPMPALQRSAMYIHSNKVNQLKLFDYDQGIYVCPPHLNGIALAEDELIAELHMNF